MIVGIAVIDYKFICYLYHLGQLEIITLLPQISKAVLIFTHTILVMGLAALNFYIFSK